MSNVSLYKFLLLNSWQIYEFFKSVLNQDIQLLLYYKTIIIIISF